MDSRRELERVALREAASEQVLDLRARLARRRRDQLLRTLGLQSGRQHEDRAQAQAPLGEPFAEHRVSVREPSDTDALVGRIFRVVEVTDAVGVQRRVARGKEEPPRAGFTQMGHDVRRGGEVLGGERGERLLQLHVVEM